MPMATGKLMPATRNHTRNELNSADSNNGLSQAVVQFVSPHCGAPINTSLAVLKLMMSRRTIG